MRFQVAFKAGVLSVATLLACNARSATPDREQIVPAQVPAQDEFLGPFPSWTNVKSTYGAVGDGRVDDTDAIQKALTELRKAGRSPVLFFPAGTYRLTRTLVLAYEQHLSLIGEDPSTVRLVWDGPGGGTMLWVNGVAYSQISRLTFDGRQRAAVAIEQSADGTGGFFDTGNTYVDDRFVDTDFGLHGGFKQAGGFAETSIVRGHFVRNTRAGVALGNFNALDIWIRNSFFEECRVGVTNEPGAGAYRVYDSVFVGSTFADLFMQNTGSFSARGNYSIGSSTFYRSRSRLNHPAAIDIQKNVIVDPLNDTPIHLSNQGPGLLIDNVVKSRSGAHGPVVSWQSPIDSDVASVGNTFTVPNRLSVGGRLISIDDRVVTRESLAPAPPQVASAPPAVRRSVFEVPAGSDAQEIQRVIDAATEAKGQRPVVHLPAGTYPIETSLRVAPSDVRIVGDGGDTRLEWKGTSAGPVLHVEGPTDATIRDLTVIGTPETDGIVVDRVDRPGSRVSLTGVQLSAGAGTNLLVDGLDHVVLQLIDVDHKYSPRGTSIRLAAGAQARRGDRVGGRTTIFSGASSGNGLSYDVAGPTTVLVRDIWYEGPVAEGFVRVRDGATFTMQGARASTPRGGPVAFTLANQGGKTTLLTTHLDDRITVSGPGPTEVLALGLLFEFHRLPVLDVAGTGSATTRLLNSRQRVETQGMFSPGTVAIADLGTADPDVIRAMLADTRAVVSPSWDRVPAGASDFRMVRVYITQSRNNLILRP